MFLKSLFKKGDIVAVGLSGGRDSIALLHILLENKDELEISVKAINIEHGIRGENSIKDSQFVKDHCEKFNVELKCFSFDVPLFAKENSLSEETAGRILRYKAFDSCVRDGFCTKIATAHHQGDNTETVLMNLFRGSSLSGLCGIKKISDDGKIVRPLLNMSREEIDNYIKNNNLNFVEDDSNSDIYYTRNFTRNKIIPIILEKFPGAISNINRFAENAKSEDDLLNNLSEKLIEDNTVLFTSDLESPLFRRACLKVCKSMGFVKDFESCHLKAIESLKNSQTGSKINLKNNIVAVRNYDRVVFEKEICKNQNSLTLIEKKFEQGEVEFGDYIIKSIPIESFKKAKEKGQLNCFKRGNYKDEKEEFSAFLREIKGSGEVLVDLDKLGYNTVIRTKREKDSIVTLGKNTKTMKKFFTDKKIPAISSKNIPLICKENNVLVVLGVDISSLVKIDKESENIVKITYFKKER